MKLSTVIKIEDQEFLENLIALSNEMRDIDNTILRLSHNLRSRNEQMWDLIKSEYPICNPDISFTKFNHETGTLTVSPRVDIKIQIMGRIEGRHA